MLFRKSKKEEKWEEKEAIKKEYLKVKPRKEGKEFDEEVNEELLPPPEDLEDEEIDEESLPPPEDLEEKGAKEGEKEEEIEKELEEEEYFEGEERDKEKKSEEEEEGRPWRSAAWDLMKDVIIAFIIVIIIIGSIYLYTGNWPPVVVVESDSMQHSDNESFLGVIDTGDLVLVKRIDGRNDVVTYMEGKRIGHETYNEYGDVLIYRKNGYTDTTPVIHRALVWLEYNQTSRSFDIPELKYHDAGTGEEGEWYVLGGEQRWYNLSGTVVLKEIGYDDVPVSINLASILSTYQIQGVDPHSGFITLGDHNKGSYDQGGSMNDGHDHRVRPIKPEWIVGKGRGELPWFGLIKLYFQDSTIRERAPSNSWTMLFITLGLIIAVPIVIDISLILYERKRARMEKKEEDEDEEFKVEKEERGAEEEIEEELGEKEEADEKEKLEEEMEGLRKEKEEAEQGRSSEEDTKEEELR